MLSGESRSDFRVDIAKASAARGVLGVAALAGDSRALSRLGEGLPDCLWDGCGVANRCGVSVEEAAAVPTGHSAAAVVDTATLARSFFAGS